MQLLLALLGVDSRDQHTAALLAHHLPGGQVGDRHQGLAHQLLGLVVLGNTGQDLPVGAGTVIQGKLQQLVGLLDRLAILDLYGPQIALAEGVKVHILGGVGTASVNSSLRSLDLRGFSFLIKKELNYG